MLFCFFSLAVEPWAGLGGSKGGGSSKSAAVVIGMGVRNWLSFPWYGGKLFYPTNYSWPKPRLKKGVGTSHRIVSSPNQNVLASHAYQKVLKPPRYFCIVN